MYGYNSGGTGNLRLDNVSLRGTVSATGSQTLTTSADYTETFNTLASAGTSSALPAGWSLNEQGTGAGSTYTAGSGDAATADTYSFGTAAADRALGGIASGSLQTRFGVCFTNQTGKAMGALGVSYTGEQWRRGGTSADSLVFEYKAGAIAINEGAGWTPLAGLNFRSLHSGSAAALDGNALANRAAVTGTVPNIGVGDGGTLCLRWTDVNASGTNDGLGIDDFTLSTILTATATTTGGAGWRLLGAPAGLSTAPTIVNTLVPLNLVQGVTGEYPNVSAANRNVRLGYDGTNFVAATSETDELVPGKGFIWYLFTAGGPTTPEQAQDAGATSYRRPLPLTFTGSTTVPGTAVTAMFDARVAGDGAYMLANPYPVAYDVDGTTEDDALLTLSTNYFVQDGSQSLTPKTRSGNASTLGGSEALVAPWQGFFVEYASRPAGAVTFTYGLDGARGASTGTLFKNAEATPAEIAFRVEGRTSGGADVRDGGNLVVLREDATDGWDRHDGSKFYMPSGTRVTAAFLGTHADGKERDKSVESRAPGAAATVPMTFTTTDAGAYRFTWDDAGTWPLGTAPVLVDDETGTRTRLDGAGEYRFASAAVYDSRRFSLDFGTATAAEAPIGAAALAFRALATPLRGTGTVTLDVPTAGMVEVRLYDLLGRLVATLHDGALTAGPHAFALDGGALPAGVYVLRAAASGSTATRSVIVVR